MGTIRNVVDFGAIPDDGKDDTEAILKAVAAAHEKTGPVVLHLPKGRFVLREIVWIERSEFVLQGAGSGADCLIQTRQRTGSRLCSIGQSRYQSGMKTGTEKWRNASSLVDIRKTEFRT